MNSKSILQTYLKLLMSVSGAIVAISNADPLSLFAGGFSLGDFFILGCVISWSTYSLLGKQVIRDLSPLLATSHAAAVGVAGLFIPACMEGMPGLVGTYALVDWGNLAYLGIFGTVIGFVWYYDGIRLIGPSRASLFINFVPISAISLAHVILGEALTPALLVGTMMVIVGVSLNQLPIAGGRIIHSA